MENHAPGMYAEEWMIPEEDQEVSFEETRERLGVCPFFDNDNFEPIEKESTT